MNFGHLIARLLCVAMFLGITSGEAVERDNYEAVPGEFLVQFRETVQPKMLLQTRSLGVKDMEELSPQSGVWIVSIDERYATTKSIDVLSTLPEIEHIEPNYIYKALDVPNDPELIRQWGLIANPQARSPSIDIGAEQAWKVCTGSHDVIVGVVDTGIDYRHRDLEANIWHGSNGEVGYDFACNDSNPDDEAGHGTHCAGTIGAVTNNGEGVAGVAWDVQLMALKFLGQWGGSCSDAIRAIDWGVDHGAHILSNSWGGGPYSWFLERAIKRARDKGVLFVAAAGNDGKDNDKRATYPAGYNVDNVVSVAALASTGDLAWFSNYGKETVDIAAPGVGIHSTYPGNRYMGMSGTSMACPHVAGVAALIKAKHPEWGYREIKDKLLKSATKLPRLEGKVAEGRYLNAAAAVSD